MNYAKRLNRRAKLERLWKQFIFRRSLLRRLKDNASRSYFKCEENLASKTISERESLIHFLEKKGFRVTNKLGSVVFIVVKNVEKYS